MSLVTRRRFLAGTGAAAAGVAAGLRWWPGQAASGGAGGAAAGDGILVFVTLAGGNDGLNTIVPVADSRYTSVRGALGVAADQTLPIGEGFGLNPLLARLHKEWDAGRMAVVHGVGFDGLDRSHFHCMDVWETADPTAHHGSGWLGRWLDVAGDDPLLGLAIGATVPGVLRGERATGATVQPGAFELPGGDAARRAVATMATSNGRTGLAVAVAESCGDLLRVLDATAPVAQRVPAAADAGPRGRLDIGAQLGAVAPLLAAGVSTRVVAVRQEGYDTHAAQHGTHEALLTELDVALASFLDALPAAVRDRVVVVLHSEFGRRVEPNANGGTDHGSSGPMLVLGSRVRSGHYGEPPPLDDLVEGDLRTTIDFRNVYAALAEGVLEVAATDVLPGRWTPVPLLR